MAARWGNSIRLQRKAMQLSQQELADRVGVTQGAVAQWEKGLFAPSPDHQLAIANSLGVAARLLFEYPQEVVA